jgi:hypothetical protein
MASSSFQAGSNGITWSSHSEILVLVLWNNPSRLVVEFVDETELTSVSGPIEELFSIHWSHLFSLQNIIFKILSATWNIGLGLQRPERIEATHAWFWKYHARNFGKESMCMKR